MAKAIFLRHGVLLIPILKQLDDGYVSEVALSKTVA